MIAADRLSVVDPPYHGGMALRDKLRERSQPFLEPGEEIRHVFLAQAGPSPWLFALSLLFAFWMKYRIVVVTDRGVLLLSASPWVPTKPKELVARLPRSTTFGELSGVWAKIQLQGEKYYVHKRFHKDVQAADAEAGSAP
jgi:hypothetical protein